jgi:hypothetical protein
MDLGPYTYEVRQGVNKSSIYGICNGQISQDYINHLPLDAYYGILSNEQGVQGVIVYTLRHGWAIIHLFCAPEQGKFLHEKFEASRVANKFALSSLRDQHVVNSYSRLGYKLAINDLPEFQYYLGSSGVIMTKVLGGGRRRRRKTRRVTRSSPKRRARTACRSA